MDLSFLFTDDNQDFILKNRQENIQSLALKNKSKNPNFPFLLLQIECWQLLEKKASEWSDYKGLIFSSRINLEQASSSKTAFWKANLVYSLFSPKNLLDLSAGMGIDAWAFSKKISKITALEINIDLIFCNKHNFKLLGADNVRFLCTEAEKFVAENQEDDFDFLYVDPSRRVQGKKVLSAAESLPRLEPILEYAQKKKVPLLIKLSPMEDIAALEREIGKPSVCICLSVKNDVKELLWLLEPRHQRNEKWAVDLGNEEETKIVMPYDTPQYCEIGEVQRYLYEPLGTILKLKLADKLAQQNSLIKLSQSSNLFTSNKLVENYPGKRFEVLEIFPAQEHKLKGMLPSKDAHVLVRNFPENAETLKKKLGLVERGDHYLIFTTGLKEKKMALWVKRL